MREIKFRAWDQWVNKMLNVELIDLVCGDISECHLDDKRVAGERIVLMQYTGLKDKNGEEIYEGDIVKEVYAVGESTYKIVFGEYKENDGEYFPTMYGYYTECLTSKFESEVQSCNNLISNHHNLRVIGNIYEHEHLLND